MSNLEAFMMMHYWLTFAAGVTVGVLAGLFLATAANCWQNHETRLEVRTRGDEHAEGLE